MSTIQISLACGFDLEPQEGRAKTGPNAALCVSVGITGDHRPWPTLPTITGAEM